MTDVRYYNNITIIIFNNKNNSMHYVLEILFK